MRGAGRVVRDRATLARIRSLAIPPAWTDVWICTEAHGHIQAVGRDARRRKQYRYHARWRSHRDDTKYGRLTDFGAVLPRLRARVARDLAQPGLPRDKVLAVLVRLLETTLIRVGNDEYARTNQSFGLTTLRDRHAQIGAGSIRFRFRGKSGKTHTIDVNDARLARLVKRCQELPGQELFQYLDESGHPQPVDSADLNAYIRDATDGDFTTKDFRTWAGTLLAASRLGPDTVPPLTGAVAFVAGRLGNTPAICRKGYIHPAVLDAFAEPPLHLLWLMARDNGRAPTGLTDDEAALLNYLGAVSAGAR